MLRRPPRSTLFPTRRSSDLSTRSSGWKNSVIPMIWSRRRLGALRYQASLNALIVRWFMRWGGTRRGARRSEEHTSELQSHVNLVCRLLLEKKKKKKQKESER